MHRGEASIGRATSWSVMAHLCQVLKNQWRDHWIHHQHAQIEVSCGDRINVPKMQFEQWTSTSRLAIDMGALTWVLPSESVISGVLSSQQSAEQCYNTSHTKSAATGTEVLTVVYNGYVVVRHMPNCQASSGCHVNDSIRCMISKCSKDIGAHWSLAVLKQCYT